jgi:hypothetical protein
MSHTPQSLLLRIQGVKAAVMIAVASLFIALAPNLAHAAPAGAAAATTEQMAKELHEGVTSQVGHRRYHHRHRYHGRRYHRPVGYYRPIRHRPRVVCRTRYRQVWTSYGYAVRPVRVCTRRW